MPKEDAGEAQAIALATAHLRNARCRILTPEEEVREGEQSGLRFWYAKWEPPRWLVVFLPVEPPNVISSAHACIVYVDPDTEKVTLLGAE